MSDFNITLFEVCELLNRSKKSISRYIRRGLLHPQEVKSQHGTLEYRFSKDDIEAFKLLDADGTEQTGQDTGDRTDETGHNNSILTENRAKTGKTRQDIRQDKTGHFAEETGHDNFIIRLLKDTNALLKDQLGKKDEQIKDLGGKIDQLIERDRETNFILKSLQDKVFMLEGGKPKVEETDQTGQPINSIKQDLTGDEDEGNYADKQPANSIDEAINEVIEPIYQTAQQTGQPAPDETGQDEKPEEIIPTKKTGFWKGLFTNKS